MEKYENTVSPRAEVVGYTRLQEAGWNFKKTYKQFEVTVALDPADEQTAKFIRDLEAVRDLEAEEITKKKPKLGPLLTKADIGRPEVVEEDGTGKLTGRLLFKFTQREDMENRKTGEKWQKRIPIYDSRGATITSKLKIGPGSIGRVSFAPNPYFAADKNTVGVSFNRLSSFKLLKYVPYTGSGPTAEQMGFGSDDDADFEGGFNVDEFLGDAGVEEEKGQEGTTTATNPLDDF